MTPSPPLLHGQRLTSLEVLVPLPPCWFPQKCFQVVYVVHRTLFFLQMGGYGHLCLHCHSDSLLQQQQNYQNSPGPASPHPTTNKTQWYNNN